MRRREFITLLGGAAAAWPLAARAQQPANSRVGYLFSGSPQGAALIQGSVPQSPSKTGYGGRNGAIEFHLSSVMLASN